MPQSWQSASSMLPCVVTYLPAPHRVHEPMPIVAAYFPAGHATHVATDVCPC